MFEVRLTAAVLAAALSISTGACAQETTTESAAPRDAVAAALPDWWQVTAFTVTQARRAEEAAAEVAPDAPARAPSKVPAPASARDAAPGKPGAAPAMPSEVTTFSASLELTQPVFEPLYALDGTAIVRPVMDAGAGLDVTGWITVDAEGAAAVTFDQMGIEELGKPLDAFDLPTLIFGTDEADAFLETRDAARAEGTMRKILGNDGDEL